MLCRLHLDAIRLCFELVDIGFDITHCLAVDIKRDLSDEVAILNALLEGKVLRPFNH